MVTNLIYSDFINSNWSFEGPAKKLKDCGGLFSHLLDPTKRKKDRQFLNNDPEVKPKIFDLVKNESLDPKSQEAEDLFKNLLEEGQKALLNSPKGPHKNPYRFFTTTLNVEITKENEKIINDWVAEQIKFFKEKFGDDLICCVLHTQESRPHLHFVLKHYQIQKNKSYKFCYQNLKSGIEGKKFCQNLTDQHQALIKNFAKTHNLKYQQDPTTEKGRNRKINDFRKGLKKVMAGAITITDKEKQALKSFVRTYLKDLIPKQPAQVKKVATIPQDIKDMFKDGTDLEFNKENLKSIIIERNKLLTPPAKQEVKQPQPVKEIVKEVVKTDPEAEFNKELAEVLKVCFPQTFKNFETGKISQVDLERKIASSILANREKANKYNKEHPTTQPITLRKGPIR